MSISRELVIEHDGILVNINLNKINQVDYFYSLIEELKKLRPDINMRVIDGFSMVYKAEELGIMNIIKNDNFLSVNLSLEYIKELNWHIKYISGKNDISISEMVYYMQIADIDKETMQIDNIKIDIALNRSICNYVLIEEKYINE